MNKVILMGRLTRDPEVRYSQGPNSTAVARYTLAVDRRFSREGEPSADFINCVAFNRYAEVAEKYFHQGLRVTISGRIQTGSYTNREGQKIYTTDVVVEEQEFAESKSSANQTLQNPASAYPQQSSISTQSYTETRTAKQTPTASQGNAYGSDGFMNIPEGIDEELPFH